MTPEEVEQIRAARALEIAPVTISMHTARRLVGLLASIEDGIPLTGKQDEELADVLGIIRHAMRYTEREHRG